MIGKTNSQRGDGYERLVISLKTDQTSHEGIVGAVITVSYSDITTEHIWEGKNISVLIPAYTDYSISVSDVNGYITPDISTFTSQPYYLRKVSFNYVYNPIRDLSLYDIYGNPISRSTANCYIVKEAGKYKFPLVYGNAIKDGAINSAAYTKNSGSYSHDFVNYKGNVIVSPYIITDTGETITSAQLSIADTDNIFTDIALSGTGTDTYVTFNIASVPETGANGVISIKDNSGTIMWNWHIWVWPYDLTPVEITNATGVAYNILPVNLATKLDTADSINTTTGWKNWFYQFGRPTPILCPSAYNSTNNHASFGVLSYAAASIASNIQTGIKNPATFYKYSSSYNYNWFQTNSSKTYNLWDAACTSTDNSDNNVVKTVYDPCPIGFKMPNGNTFTGFSVINDMHGIVKFTRYSGDSTGVGFPMSGFRSYSDGSLNLVGSYGYVWLSSAGSQNRAYSLYFNSSYVYPQNYSNRASGYSVRPVADTNIIFNGITFTINGVTYQANNNMTWQEWINSAYNTTGYRQSTYKSSAITRDDISSLPDVEYGIGISMGSLVNITDTIISGQNYVHGYIIAP